MSIVSLSSKNEIKEVTKETIIDLAKKAAKSLQSKNGDLMLSVKIKGTGMGFYWSPYDKKLILVPRRAEYYFLPWQADEKGRKYLFLPFYLTSGTVICVDPNELDFLGYN
jgi:hypothetical protein